MWWLATVAEAHEPGLSRLVVDDTSVAWSVATADEVDPRWIALVTVRRGDAACTASSPTTSPADADGVEIRAALQCPPGDGPLEVEVGFLDHLPPGHRALLEANGAPVAWLDAAHASATLPEGASPPSAWGVAGQYLGLGVEHILTGWDHLLFLCGLLLGVKTLREAAAVVTGFTLAHSVTLALAATQVIVLPGSLVEPAIALTVAWVGVENLLGSGPRRRIALTALLGLVHGLGFAGLLAELGFPEGQRIPALVSFNAGVELGQLAVVALVLPILVRLREQPAFGTVLKVASGLVIAVGLGWFVERVI